jgi:hypothetical protein
MNPHEVAVSMEGAPAATRAASASASRVAWWHYGLILALALVTRGWLWNNPTGEPDTARYVFGLRFWTQIGPDAPGIINRELSSGYYWLAAHLARLGDVPFSGFPRLLGGVSLCAAALTGPALYHLGGRFVSRTASLVAAIALLLSPGWWWTGLQAHPQGLTLALQLTSLIAFHEAWRRSAPRGRVAWLLLSGAALTAALLVKSDAALLAPAYIGILLFQRSAAGRPLLARATLPGVAATGALLAAAYAAFVGMRRLIMGPLHEDVQATAHIGRFLYLPGDLGSVLSQAAPIVFGPGPLVLLVTLGAAAAFFRVADTPARLRWAILLIAWALPGYVFWICIEGNNARHVIPFAIPIVWLGFAWLGRRGGWRLSALAMAAIAGNLIVPANSGVSLYPSMNVPASAALMRARQDELREVAARLVAADAEPVCYVGRTTQDYVTQYVLEDADRAGYAVEPLPGPQLTLRLRHDDGRIKRVNMIGLRGRQDAGLDPRQWPGCALVETVEYDAAGRRHRFFGTEPRVFDALVRAVN